jgi:hypothetical protein
MKKNEEDFYRYSPRRRWRNHFNQARPAATGATARKMTAGLSHGKARWIVNPDAVRELLAKLSATIQAANENLAELDKGERALRIFVEGLKSMTARLTKSVEALR